MEGEGDYECRFFYEDEVYRFQEKTGRTQFGIVLENSEYGSSDEDSDTESESSRKLKRGQVRVTWYPTGKESVISEKKVKLADRSLMPGDVVVRKENGREKMCGYCRHVNSVASLNVVGTDHVIDMVSSEELEPLEEFSPDIAVTLDDWVGMTHEVKSMLTMRTMDGSLCTMYDHQAMDLKGVDDKHSRNSEFHRSEFYPGQYLSGKLSQFSFAKWLEGGPDRICGDTPLKMRHKLKVVARVEKVQVVSLGVQWQCQAWSSKETAGLLLNNQPKFIVDGEDLQRVKMLNVFEPCTLQLGDKSFYRLKPTDVVVSFKDWMNLKNSQLFPEQVPKSRQPTRRAAATGGKAGAATRRSQHPPVEDEDDEWQNEADEEVIDGEDELESSRNEGASCLPEGACHRGNGVSSGTKTSHGGSLALATRSLKKRKLRKAKSKQQQQQQMLTPGAGVGGSVGGGGSAASRIGDQLVVETLCTYSWVDVVWQDGSMELGVSSKDLYPVHHLDDKEFFPGDFVVPADRSAHSALGTYGVVQRVDAQARTALVQWFQPGTTKPDTLHVEEVSVYDLKDHPDFKFRPGSIVVRVADSGDSEVVGSAGQVLDNLPTGQVDVWWAEGPTSRCWPQDLYRVGDYDSDAGEQWDDAVEMADMEDDDEGEGIAAGLADEDDPGQESWETESEMSFDGDISAEDAVAAKNCGNCKLKPRHVHKMRSYLDRARDALARFETLLTGIGERGTLATISVGVAESLNLLLDVYKQCRFLDRLMGTSYFDEQNFEGLLQRINPFDRRHQCQYPLPEQFASEMHEFLALRSQPWRQDRLAEPCVDQDRILQACLKLGRLLSAQLFRFNEDMDSRKNEPEVEQVVADAAVKVVGEEVVKECVKEIRPEEETQVVEEVFEAIQSEDLISRSTFAVVESAPCSHKFYSCESRPVDAKSFQKSLRNELAVLRTSLPQGIHVKTFEDRMDLFSVLIEGPAKTPYEGGVFLFDFQLPNDYPKNPPLCHYWSYCSERLNPNLYEEGKVCVSLLGTWSGKGSEVWGPGSNLLQVLVSIQGLILVSEPYYNEAGYERQRGSVQARENSRLYNEMVLLKMLQAMGRLCQKTPDIWRQEINEILQREAPLLMSRYKLWVSCSSQPACEQSLSCPDFPLVPASKGFCLTLEKSLKTFQSIFESTLLKISCRSCSSPKDSADDSRESVPNLSIVSSEEANLSR